MDAVCVYKDNCPLGDDIVVVDIVFRGCMGESIGRYGAVKLDLFDDGADVGELGFVSELG